MRKSSALSVLAISLLSAAGNSAFADIPNSPIVATVSVYNNMTNKFINRNEEMSYAVLLAPYNPNNFVTVPCPSQQALPFGVAFPAPSISGPVIQANYLQSDFTKANECGLTFNQSSRSNSLQRYPQGIPIVMVYTSNQNQLNIQLANSPYDAYVSVFCNGQPIEINSTSGTACAAPLGQVTNVLINFSNHL